MSDVVLKGSEVDWDWTAKHTRLRYQLVLSSVILFLLSAYKGSELSLPFLFINFSDDFRPTSLSMVFALWGFYIFTLVSFIMRTRNEKKLLSPRYTVLIEQLNLVRGRLNRLSFAVSGEQKIPKGNWQEAGDLIENLEKYISELDSLIVSESSAKKTVFIERELLGFWVPTVLSILLVLLSLMYSVDICGTLNVK